MDVYEYDCRIKRQFPCVISGKQESKLYVDDSLIECLSTWKWGPLIDTDKHVPTLKPFLNPFSITCHLKNLILSINSILKIFILTRTALPSISREKLGLIVGSIRAERREQCPRAWSKFIAQYHWLLHVEMNTTVKSTGDTHTYGYIY